MISSGRDTWWSAQRRVLRGPQLTRPYVLGISRNADPNIGPRLPDLLEAAGSSDIDMKLVHQAALHGPIKELICVTLESIGETVIRDGLTTAEEFAKTARELRAFGDDPRTIMAGPFVYQVWGRTQS